MTERVLWLDGLPLAPQHFQEAERLRDEAVDARLRATLGTGWGLRDVELDAAALGEGIVRIVRLEVVFSDGAVARIGPGSEVRIDERRVVGFGTDRREIVAHIAVAAARPGRREIGIDGARLRVVERRCGDVHTETPAEPVLLETGVLAPRIVFDHEPHDGLTTVPLVGLCRTESGEIVTSDAIVGPLLAIGASEPLMARLRKLVERLGTRRASLFAARHERDGESIGDTDARRLLLGAAIATHHPVLRHQLRAAFARPVDLFERLLALAGALSVFAVESELDVPDFDSLAPGASLVALFDRIDALLSATDRERARAITLEARTDGLHFARLDDTVARAERFYVSVRSVVRGDQVESSLPGLAKVASYGEIAGVLDSATPGAPLRVVHRPPPDVPVRAGETCFELAVTDARLRAALAERALAVFLPARTFDPAHTRLTLLAIAPRHPERSTDRSFPTLDARAELRP
jgi:type VI secretion system protein ImpJ